MLETQIKNLTQSIELNTLMLNKVVEVLTANIVTSDSNETRGHTPVDTTKLKEASNFDSFESKVNEEPLFTHKNIKDLAKGKLAIGVSRKIIKDIIVSFDADNIDSLKESVLKECYGEIEVLCNDKGEK